MSTTHKRIRPFNTKDTYPEQDLDNDLCQAVVAGGVVYLRGQIGQDLDTRESVASATSPVQTEKAMSNIAMLLDEAGSSLRDIVKVTVYLNRHRYAKPVYRVMAAGSRVSTRSRRGWSSRHSRARNGWWRSTPPPSSARAATHDLLPPRAGTPAPAHSAS